MRNLLGVIVLMNIGLPGFAVAAQSPVLVVAPDLPDVLMRKSVSEKTRFTSPYAPEQWPFTLPRRKPQPGALELLPDLPSALTAQPALTRTAFVDLKKSLLRDWPVALRGASFIKAQKTLQSDASAPGGRDPAGPGSSIFRFYLAHGLYAEALALLPMGPALYTEAIDAKGRAAVLVALFGSGRYAEIVAMGKETSEVATTPYATAALAALGQYRAADEQFGTNDHRTPVFFAEEICLRKAETRLMLGKDTQPVTCPQGDAPPALRAFVNAGEALRVQEQAMTAQSAPITGDQEPALARARVLSFRKGFDLGVLASDELLRRLQDLISHYPASDVERDALDLYADVTASAGDFTTSLNANRRLMVYYPGSDSGRRAMEKGRKTLDQLLRSQESMPAFELAALVYQYIDWLEPGDEGDAQIRMLASRLVDLDLIGEAAELLDHQIRHRLTGAERAKRAVDLAALYLKDKREKDAIRILKDTRQTGLAPTVQHARRHVEARALWALGKHDQALARLEVADEIGLPSQSLLLRARIQFDMGDAQAAFPTLYRQALRRLQNRDQSSQAEIDIAMAFAAAMASDKKAEAEQLTQLTAATWPSSDLSRLLISFQDTSADGTVTVDFISAFSQWMAGKRANTDAGLGPDAI